MRGMSAVIGLVIAVTHCGLVFIYDSSFELTAQAL
jgi:hypothetical protein